MVPGKNLTWRKPVSGTPRTTGVGRPSSSA